MAGVNGRYEGIEAYGAGVVYDPCTMWLREGPQEITQCLASWTAVGYKVNEGCKSLHTLRLKIRRLVN